MPARKYSNRESDIFFTKNEFPDLQNGEFKERRSSREVGVYSLARAKNLKGRWDQKNSGEFRDTEDIRERKE